jgi:alcohol dehydrogenase class IV
MGRVLRVNFPGVSFVGPGAVEVLGEQAAGLGSRALLVTGRRALRAAGTTDRIESLLDGAGLSVVLFEGAPPEPDLAAVESARKLARREGCDVVVEAGGGSAIDVGKVAAALAREEAPVAEFHAGGPIERPGLPHVAVATTAGTGAEVTRNGVITDPATGVKKSIRGDGVMPNVSITDAELTLSCPPDVTAAAGMDALVQAVESFVSVHAILTTEALSLGAVKLIVPALPAAYRDGSDMAARSALAEGSYMAGLALGSARLGAVHGLAHPLGVCCGVPHGAVCAALMVPVLRRNMAAISGKYEVLRDAMGGDPIEVFEGLLETLGMSAVLGAYPEAQWEREIVRYAVGTGSSKANPVPVDEGYVLEVLAEVCPRAGAPGDASRPGPAGA